MNLRIEHPTPELPAPYDMYGPGAFTRNDESDDRIFYGRDRFVSHLDATALKTVEALIGTLVVEDRPVILDLMASWDSHLPGSLRPERVTGLGLNANELARNPALTDFMLHDLNGEGGIPFPDATFDVVLNTVSVDYLARPFEVFREVGRVLKPGGLHLVIFSNRMFPQKATRIWQESTERERVRLVIHFFESAGCFESPTLFVSSGRPRPEDDKYAHLGIPSDPVYAVYAEKSGAERGGRKRPDPAELLAEGKAGAAGGEGEAGEGDITMPEPLEDHQAFAGRTLRCPHCGRRLKKWNIPNNPFSDWDTDRLYVCANIACPYLVRGWRVMTEQGVPGMSYRFVYDPKRGSTLALPIMSLQAMNDDLED